MQAAELPQALATGMVNAFMTSGATGYDSKAWESLSHFYDTQAWIPKNVTFVNKAAFDALDKPTQDAVLKAAAAAEERGWKIAEEKTGWYLDQLKAKGMKVQPPSPALKAGLKKIGEQLTADWLTKAGPDGQAVDRRLQEVTPPGVRPAGSDPFGVRPQRPPSFELTPSPREVDQGGGLQQLLGRHRQRTARRVAAREQAGDAVRQRPDVQRHHQGGRTLARPAWRRRWPRRPGAARRTRGRRPPAARDARRPAAPASNMAEK